MAGGRPNPDHVARALEAGDVGVWFWEAATSRLDWSPEVERFFGLEPGSFGGTFEDYLMLLPEEERDRVKAEVDAAFAARSQTFVLNHWIRPNGREPRWLQCWGSVLQDEEGRPVGMAGVTVDVTRRRQTEEALAQKERQLDLIRELASDYVYEIDWGDTTPAIVSGSFERTTGYTPLQLHELGGWAQVIHPDDRGINDIVREAVESNRPLVVEYRIRDGFGAHKWLRDRIQPLPSPERPRRIVGTVQDITELKELELQLRQSQKLEALAQLSGSVAHDFNNLLTVMMSALDTLRIDLDRGRAVDDSLADLEGALGRGAELARSLLAFGQRQTAVLRPLDLNDASQKARSMLRRVVGEGYDIELALCPEPVWVRADLGQLELILLNLVINARDAEPRDGVVRISTTTSVLGNLDARRPAELPPGTYAELCVEDRGHGMSVEVQSRIFEPFFTTKDQGHGTGLGLSTVHGIVRSWGGAIFVRSEPGKGTELRIFLPVAEAEPASQQPTPRVHSVGGKEHVFLVEDDLLVRRAALRALREHGYSVSDFASAEALLDSQLLPGKPGALLLSDVRLGGLDGITLAERVSVLYPDLRVLLMSGYVEHEEQQSIISTGRFGFLAKPFTPEGLARRVREVLDSPLPGREAP